MPRGAKLLGNDAAYSRPIFLKVFDDPARALPLFKSHVSTSADRWTYRGFAKNTSITDSFKAILTGKTNYMAVRKDVEACEEKGSLAHVASFRFLIDAEDPEVAKTDVNGLQMVKHVPDPLQRRPGVLALPKMYRLLIEEHVYVFAWSPVLSETYKALMAAVAGARLVKAAASTVATFGANAPELIDALQNAAQVTGNLIAMTSEVGNVVTRIQALGEGAGEVAGHYADTKSSLASLIEPGPAFQKASTLDAAALPAAATPQTVSTWFGRAQRVETQQEMLVRQGKELAVMEAEIQKLNFVVVQQITPIIQTRDDTEVKPGQGLVPHLHFKACTYVSRKALFRVGETSRDRFNQMVAAAKSSAYTDKRLAPLFCKPWSTGNGYLQFMRDDTKATDSDPGELQPLPLTTSAAGLVRWDESLDQQWQRLDSVQGTTVWAPDVQKARSAMLAEVQQRGRAIVEGKASEQAREIQRLRQQLSQATAAQQQSRRQNQEERALRQRQEQINKALIAGQLPTREQFQLETTTRVGLYVNRRKNPHLLMIDDALLAWHEAKRSSHAMRGIEQMKGALLTIIGACDSYITSKARATGMFGGSLSDRIVPVGNVRATAIRIYHALP